VRATPHPSGGNGYAYSHDFRQFNLFAVQAGRETVDGFRFRGPNFACGLLLAACCMSSQYRNHSFSPHRLLSTFKIPGEEVIELSVEETNELRAKLGLVPLRIGKTTEQTESVLELSVDATNDLRKSLGLAPLRVEDKDRTGRYAQQAVHKPAENIGEAKEVQERLEKVRLQRQVQKGISNTFETSTLGEDNADVSKALSWA
jgi:HIND motif